MKKRHFLPIHTGGFKAQEMIGIFLLACLLSFCLKDLVNSIALTVLPESTVSVRAIANDRNSGVTVVSEGSDNELFNKLFEASDKAATGWKYVKGEPGVKWTSLTLPPEDGEVKIMVKTSPRLYLAVFGNRNGGIIELNNGDEIIVQDCYVDSDGTELIRVFPFKKSKSIIWIKGILYVMMIVIISLLLFIAGCFIKNRGDSNGLISAYFRKPITTVDFFICWAGLFVLAVFIYKVIGIPNFLSLGDDIAYWDNVLLNNGKWDTAMLASRFTPRGYWCYIPQTIAQYLGDAISVDAKIIWMLIPSATISWLVVKIFPGLFTIMGGKAMKYHILPMLLVLLTVWLDCLTAVLMDLFGVAFLFASIYYIIRFFKTKEMTSAILAGITASVACSFRTANLLGIIVIVLYEIITMIKKIGKKEKIRKTIIGIMAGILSFVIICLPQLQVNMFRNHFGLFPYDHDQAWNGRSLMCWSSDIAITHYNISYPVAATDAQMHTMKESAYKRDVPLNMEQLLDTYMESPIETLMLMVKKVIIGFDKKTNIAYPDPGPGVPWRETGGMLFSLWNYFILFAGLYVLFTKKEITKEEKTLALIVFIFLVLPETFMKMEWRYCIAGYMMLYYFFTFYFCGDLICSKNERVELLTHSKFLIAFVVFAFAFFSYSFISLA